MDITITRTVEYTLSVDVADDAMLAAIREKLTELGVEGDTLSEQLDNVYSQDIEPALAWLAEQGDTDDDTYVCDSLDQDDLIEMEEEADDDYDAVVPA